MDDASRALTPGTGGGGGEGEGPAPPLDADLPGAPAVGAHLGGGAGGAAGAPAGLTGLRAGDGDLLLTAEGRLLKGDGHRRAEVLPPPGGVGVGPLGAAKAAAEEGAEQVPQVDVPHVEPAEAAPAGPFAVP